MSAAAAEQSDAWEELESDVLVDVELPEATGVRAALADSDRILVEALNAVARLRDTVDRVIVFCELRQLLEREAKVLDRTIENEQRELDNVLRTRRSRLCELGTRREQLARVLGEHGQVECSAVGNSSASSG